MLGTHPGSNLVLNRTAEGESLSHMSVVKIHGGCMLMVLLTDLFVHFLLGQAFCFYDKNIKIHGKIKNTEYSIRRVVMRAGLGGSYGITK